ncbi:MAG TPA: carbohydrate-binding protein, partial [Myxococcaceae bacterium]|nr:carbohydrate-binding protein [Myxococcaceae bacterium]
MTTEIRPATLARPKAPQSTLPYDAEHPQLALLSNSQYGVIITAAGAGVSTWRGLDVTRWREDVTRDCWGQFCYVRDLSEDKTWSVGHQPLCRAADEYEVKFHPRKAEFRRLDGDIETRWAVCVMPDADSEVRAMTIVNHGNRPRELELTSYAEVCLSNRRGDQAHPAFGKLFLETQFDKPTGALLARRRPRGAEEKPVWVVHVSSANEAASGAIDYETDRVRFLGRGRTAANPAAMDPRAFLSKTTGPVLDPVFSLRRRVHLRPGETACVAFITGAADTREEALAIAEPFQDFGAADRAFSAALVESQKENQELSLTPDDVALFNRLATAVLFTDSKLRQLDAIAANRLGQSGLWPHAISGDLPIVLVRVAGVADESLVRELIKWHAYVRRRGLESDLVILDERDDDSSNRLKDELQASAS